MRVDPIDKTEFEPTNPNHYFAQMTSFLTFIRNHDPMEVFAPEKREIKWKPQERVDPQTGETFIAYHPAQIYAPKPD